MIPEDIKEQIKEVTKLKVVSRDKTEYNFDSVTNTLSVPIYETNFYDMFSCCDMKEIDLWVDNKIENVTGMFSNCYRLKKVLFTKKLNLENVYYLSGMFYGCGLIEEIDLSNIITSNRLCNINRMFDVCKSLREVNFGDNFHSENIITANGLFNFCYSLENIIWRDCQPFNKLLYFNNAFYNCVTLPYIDLRGVNFNNIKESSNLFFNTHPDLEVLVNRTYVKKY